MATQTPKDKGLNMAKELLDASIFFVKIMISPLVSGRVKSTNPTLSAVAVMSPTTMSTLSFARA